MKEMERIRDQLKRAFHGDAWHGPSLREILNGVTPAGATTRLASGHSIREIVRHITVWTDVCGHRLADEPIPDVTAEEDWPAVDELDDAEWEKDLENLFGAEKRLQALLRGFPESRLDAIVPGYDYSFYVMLQGAVQHALYHGGQIAVLKKSKD